MKVSYLDRYMVGSAEEGGLTSLSLQRFVHSVGARTAAPGGGSVSAAIGALVSLQRLSSRGSHLHILIQLTFSFLQGAALGAMVGQMTYGKRQFEDLDSVMRRLIPPFHQAMNELLLMVEADSSAFNSYMVTTHPKPPLHTTTPTCSKHNTATCWQHHLWMHQIKP